MSKTVLPVLIRSHAHLVGPDVDIDKVVEMLGQPIEGRTFQGCLNLFYPRLFASVELVRDHQSVGIKSCSVGASVELYAFFMKEENENFNVRIGIN